MSSLAQIVAAFLSKRVLVVGDVILDHYVWGSADRISQEAPVPIVTVLQETYRLGGAANAVANIISLGGNVSVISVIGNDENGSKLLSMLSDIGADTTGLVLNNERPTSIKTRVMAHHQHIVRIDREVNDEIAGDIRAEIISRAMAEIPKVDAVLISDYDKGVTSKIFFCEVIRCSKEHGKPVVIDPKIRNFWNYAGATVITPNIKEASAAANMAINDEEELLKAGVLIFRKLDLQALIITRGEHGMTFFQPDGKPEVQPSVTHIPAVAREVFDVTGAGDTVAAVLALSLASGADIPCAARISNYAAGIVVGEVGTACASPEELLSVIEQYEGIRNV